MPLKLYGSLTSTCTRRVAVILHEKRVPFEFIVVQMAKGEHKDPAYLENQPFGQVPYIDDNGFILYESRAIAWYIAAKYPDRGTRLIPNDLQGQARLMQAWSVETSHFVHAEQAAFEAIFKRNRGLDTDPVILKRHQEALERTLDVYDKILGKQKYLAGDELTLVDLFHLPYAYILPRTGIDPIPTKPNVKRWYEDVSNRPTWQLVKDQVHPFTE